MAKVTYEFDAKDVIELVEKLSMDDKIKLVRRLEQETWGQRIDKLLKRIDERRKNYPISDEEIAKEIETVRREMYGPRRNR